MKLSEDGDEEKSPNSSPLLLVSCDDEDDHVLDSGDNDDEGEHPNMYMNKYGCEKSPNASPLLVLRADDVLCE